MNGWLINDDEGSFLYQAWRISLGEQPYNDFFTSRWPLFLYTGGVWMRLFGASIVPIRALAACLTLGTAVLVFLIGKRVLPWKISLLSMIIFLLHPDVFHYARLYQPEPFYLFFSTLGLYLFIKASTERKIILFLIAGLTFAIANQFKILSSLVFMGCLLSLVIVWLQGKERRLITRSIIFFLGSYVVLLSTSIVFFTIYFPDFLKFVFGVNLVQGNSLPLLSVLDKGVHFLFEYFVDFPFIIFSFAGAIYGWRKNQTSSILTCQLATALSYLILSRELYPRLLLYLTPSLVVLFVLSYKLFQKKKYHYILYLLILLIFFRPWIFSVYTNAVRSEKDTMAVVDFIQSHTQPADLVVSDYQELNFFSKRASTRLGSEISYVVVTGGLFSVQDYISNIDNERVKMVIFDISPKTGEHLIKINDFQILQAFIDERFNHVTTMQRGEQVLEIHYKD